MASAGLRKTSLGSDRQLLGLMSLGIGAALFLLIGLRALQAHRDGDRQLRNDSLWVLVSPLVFGGFGLRLLTLPPAAAGRRPLPELQSARAAVQQAQAAAEQAHQLEQAGNHQALQSQWLQAERELETSRSEASALEAQLRQVVQAGEQRAAELEQQLTDLQQQRLAPLAAALQHQIHTFERRLAELDAALQQQHIQALQQLQEQMEEELQRQLAEQISQRLAAFSDSWQGRLEEARRELAALQGDGREQWQQLDRQLRGLDDELQVLAHQQQGLQQRLSSSLSQHDRQQAQLQQRATAAVAGAESVRSSLRQQLDQLQGQRDVLSRHAAALELQIQRLDRSTATAENPVQGFEGSVEDACAELGVLPGSPWSAVRAVWRQGLLRWHPEQGGDPGLWPRRQAAYQLLEAWYAFRQLPG